jgi:4-amino-4-deoxy-L-arabinose transferase-like glycosyltransferase
MYRIVKLLDNETTALVAAAVFAFLPYNVFYSRVVLPEIALVFFSLASIYLGIKLLYEKRTSALVSGIWCLVSAVALLLKPTAIFFIAPVVGIYLWSFYKKEITARNCLYTCFLYLVLYSLCYCGASGSPNYPEGIPANLWLLNGDGIRFKGAWFHWLFADRLGRLILGYWGLIPFGLGILSLEALTSHLAHSTSNTFYSLWLVSCFLYLTIFRHRQRPSRLLPNHPYPHHRHPPRPWMCRYVI